MQKVATQPEQSPGKAALALLLTLGLVVVALSACTRDAPAPAKPPDPARSPLYAAYRFAPPEEAVRIGIQPFWPYVANIVEAMRRDRILQQQLSELGLRAEFYPFVTGPDLNFCMERGDLDVGMAGSLPTLTIASRRDIRVAAVLDRNYYDLVVRDALTIADLRGKRIGVPFGADPHQALDDALRCANVPARLVDMDVTAMPDRLRTRDVAAVMAWEPATSALLSEDLDYRVVYRVKWVSFLYFDGAFTRRQPEAVDALVAAMLRGINWLRQEDERFERSSRWAVAACAAIAPDGAPVAPEMFAAQSRPPASLSLSSEIPRSIFEGNGLMARVFDFLRREDMIGAATDWAMLQTAFDMESVPAILASPEKSRLHEFDYRLQEDSP